LVDRYPKQQEAKLSLV